MEIVSDVTRLRKVIGEWHNHGEKIAFVPTMGGLHSGHTSLITRGRELAHKCVLSIFVNPRQFGENEDFAAYPRTLTEDFQLADTNLCDLVFVPEPKTIYPDNFVTSITIQGPAKVDLEDRFRPHHFDGVVMVVAKLFNLIEADYALFGEKDYQQLLCVRTLVKDLNYDIDIIACPTKRESDGLALSTRNRYLSIQERKVAPMLFKALTNAALSLSEGRNIDDIEQYATRFLIDAGFSAIDYFAIRDSAKLTSPVNNSSCRILAAAKLGSTRLIDNISSYQTSSVRS